MIAAFKRLVIVAVLGLDVAKRMRKFFSWGGLDKTLSKRAQTISIFAAALAHLIFLNANVRDLLKDFISPMHQGGRCQLFAEPIEAKLIYLYLSVFFLGLGSVIIKVFMPVVIKESRSRQRFIEDSRTSEIQTIVRHCTDNIDETTILKKAISKKIGSLIESAKALNLTTENDKKRFSDSYFSLYYDYESASIFWAPLAKFAIAASAFIFAVQALKTFFSVICHLSNS